MRRRVLVSLAALGLGLTLVACGGDDSGGGGDEEGFCEGLESLSDEVADGALTSDEGLGDLVESVNDGLLQDAPDGDELDAVRDVRDLLIDADPDDADDTAEEIQDELGDFAEDCDIDGDDFAVGPEVTTTTTEEEPSTTTTDEEPTTSIVEPTTGGGGPGGSVLIEARQPVPAGIGADFQGSAQDCFEGDAPRCDQLWSTSAAGSIEEEYGATCGGRVPDGAAGECSTLITAPEAPAVEIVDQDTAFDCYGGDMQACDDLYNNAEAGSEDQRYGALCGDRIQNTQEFCVPIFGEQAAF